MSSQFQNKYTPTTKQIYSILDNLEDRLNRYTTYSSYGKGYNKNYYNVYNKNNEEINNKGNELINGQQAQLYNQNIENNNNIKNIISNEFNSLIIPYQRDFNSNIYNLESKINSINLKLDKLSTNNNNDIDNLLINKEYLNKNKLNNNTDYISREEFESKSLELNNQISLLNSVIISLKNNNNKPFDNNLNNENNSNNENKKVLDEINIFKNTIYRDIEQVNQKFDTNLKEYDIKIKNILEDLNIIKEDYKSLNYELGLLKININNINKVHKDNESISKEKYLEKSFNENFLINDIKEYKNKISNLEKNLKNLEENNNFDIQYLKKELSNLDLKFKNIEKPAVNSDINSSINNTNNIRISRNEKNNEYIEGLIRNYFQDFKKENENNINELNSKLDNKNEEIFKYFEKYDNTIKNLNTKIEKINNNLEIDNKKKFNHLNEKIEKSIIELNESNIGFNNESRFANNLMGNDNINNIKLQIKNQNLKIDRLDSEIKDKLINIDEQILNNEKKINSLEEKINENRDKIKKIENDGFNNKKNESNYFDEIRKNKEKIYIEEKRSSREISKKDETNKDMDNKSENKTSKKEEKKEKDDEILSIESLLIDN